MKVAAIIIFGIVVAAVAAGAVAFRHRPPPASTIAMAAIPVVAGTVQSKDVPIFLEGVGTVVAFNTDIVRSQISGQLISIRFDEGQAVKAGDVLAVIDPKPFQAKVDQMTANRARDQAELDNAKLNLKRSTDLIGKGFATQQLLDTQKAQVDQLQGAVQSDDALIEQAKVELDYTKLTSPISGITGIRQIDVGNVIRPTDASGLVTVTQIEPISMIFTLPEDRLAQVQQRMSQAAPLSVIAFSQDGRTKLDEGTLTLIDNEILQATGSIQLKSQFANGQHRLWPGQLVNARLLLDTQHDGLTVAASAVQRGPAGNFVYVISPDGTAESRSVTVAQIVAGEALVTSGLQANDKVVIDGQYRLQNGSAVRELTGKAAKEADLQSAVEKAIP
ncbi:multidrug efflux system membrane fusion protein [Tardiphaga robiniae]|uniref:efflux RND transporter periplasmic adaptor subunit n=1 Tax=Tardiphaga robiniae TaxID=943830 RepID=UPI00286497F7|nr:efflux RND transporter periplasmic adaptor subunit [Tardiphaga robiniae]MDR6661313.1 multidrug efflux system membrane fusion protein [Tardiphaga robiniae]